MTKTTETTPKKGDHIMASHTASRPHLTTGRAGRAIAVGLAGSLLLSACATTGNSTASGQCSSSTAQLSAAEMQLCKDSQVFNETVAGGAAAGALAGILVGALAGALTGDSRNIAKGALIGGVAGGIAGGVDGYITAKAQESGNNRVRMVEAMTRDVDADNTRLKALVNSSNQVLADSRSRLERTTAEYKSGKTSLANLESERKRLEDNRGLMQASLESLRKKRDNYQEASLQMASNGASTTQFNSKISELNTQIAQLEENVSGMNAALTISKV
ncbi:hypothetical protein JJL56_06235 [Azospirillum sp. YIM DDC1]|uniref:Glycine zipper domain-containing protein n=1 Tax=Azospirillum aestuarii TaxID=2802052 RepID=A0ABS1HUG3_9PROT|nr:hypothetical protein [Azospirillum aestuarii]MBK4718461.1 hypothetical protein [Azospirillum aestuarii]